MAKFIIDIKANLHYAPGLQSIIDKLKVYAGQVNSLKKSIPVFSEDDRRRLLSVFPESEPPAPANDAYVFVLTARYDKRTGQVVQITSKMIPPGEDTPETNTQAHNPEEAVDMFNRALRDDIEKTLRDIPDWDHAARIRTTEDGETVINEKYHVPDPPYSHHCIWFE